MAIFNITTTTDDVTPIVANTTNIICTNSGMSIIPPGFLVHRPTGFHLLSSQVRHCCLPSTDVLVFMLMMEDDDVGGVQFCNE